MNVIAFTGAFTAFLGATIAITKTTSKGSGLLHDSQLGYMVMAMGVGAYSAGPPPMTHAYFKAMLFLGSGSVIHGMEGVVGHDPALAQDMRMMGLVEVYAVYGDYLLDWLPRDFRNPTICWLLVER